MNIVEIGGNPEQFVTTLFRLSSLSVEKYMYMYFGWKMNVTVEVNSYLDKYNILKIYQTSWKDE